MKKHLFQRRAPLIVLLLAMALGLLLAGIYQAPENSATAATPPPWEPKITIPGDLPIDPVYGLRASSFSPASGETEVTLNPVISVKMSLDIVESTLTAGFKVRKTTSLGYLSCSRHYNSSTNIATLDPLSSLEPGATYEVVLTDAIATPTDLHLLNPQSWRFHTITWPEVQSHTPPAGAIDVPVGSAVQIIFDKEVKWSTVDSDSVYIHESGGSKIYCTMAKGFDNQTLTLTPSPALQPATTYIATVTVAVQAENGLYMQAPVTWTFTTAAGTPHVIAKVPASGATGVPVSQTISATFDKDMDDSTITEATFYIKKSGGTPLPSSVDYSAATRTATLDPLADLEAGATYEVRLTTAVESESGTALASAVVWSFATAGAAPSVTTKVPAAGASSVPVDQTIAATFDGDMDASTLTGATFYVQKSGGSSLPATVAYSSGTRTATLDPLADLEAGAAYQVTLTTAVEGADGQTLSGAPVTWSFTTVSDGGGSSFSDIAGSPYAAAIIALADEGIISGYTDGTFGPSNPVFRKHFAKMIVGVMGLPVSEADWSDSNKPFTDCGADDLADIYPHDYIAVAKANGLTQGKTATTFAPNDNITRQQLITMIARAASLSEPPASFAPSFNASQFYPNEHYLNARKLAYAGLLDGLVGVGPSYDFFAPATRGECAQLLYNLLLLVTS
ncbi:MAG: Ig-like domain-containing protein [Thermoleophilia bacterium]|nr:Ig-like domain-containing protein [Thermoleophilia bacterium]